MNTRLEVSVPAGPDAAAALDAVVRIFRQVAVDANEWLEGSPLAEVNRQAGASPVPVPASLMRLLERGVEIGRLTDGAFDVTWAALWGLWDFNQTAPRRPDPGVLEARVKLVDFRRLELNSGAGTVRLPLAGMKVGLGGIAKGFTLQLAGDELHRRGISDFLLSAGGQYLAGGRKGGRPWRIGIRDPRGGGDEFFAVIDAEDVSVSTSGDYERWFEQDGVRYHHILDPRTGLPARGLRSVTVIASDAVIADAFSTALMVMGKERGLELATRTPGLEAVFVDDAGGLTVTPGLAGRLELLRPPRP